MLSYVLYLELGVIASALSMCYSQGGHSLELRPRPPTVIAGGSKWNIERKKVLESLAFPIPLFYFVTQFCENLLRVLQRIVIPLGLFKHSPLFIASTRCKIAISISSRMWTGQTPTLTLNTLHKINILRIISLIRFTSLHHKITIDFVVSPVNKLITKTTLNFPVFYCQTADFVL